MGTLIRGTRIVAQALLAIPDVSPACFAHRARQASVPHAPGRDIDPGTAIVAFQAPLQFRFSPRCFAHWARSAPVPAKYLRTRLRRCGRMFTIRLDKKKPQHKLRLFLMESGSDLLSRAVSSQVPSALKGLTSVFGMGTGGTLSPLSPEFSRVRFVP